METETIWYGANLEAEAKAFHLLYYSLTPLQREQWHKERVFICIGGTTKTPYAVMDYGVGRRLWIHNVYCYSSKELLGSFTLPFDTPNSLPCYDNLYIKKMYIENLEDDFLGRNCVYHGNTISLPRFDNLKDCLLRHHWCGEIPNFLKPIFHDYEGDQFDPELYRKILQVKLEKEKRNKWREFTLWLGQRF